jgi:hypothetical protein
VRKHLPADSIVFDHFHLIKLFNDKLQQFRRWLFNQAQGSTEQKILKGIRWLWPTTITASQPAHWRAPTTKSKPSSGRLTAAATMNSSNSKSWRFI